MVAALVVASGGVALALEQQPKASSSTPSTQQTTTQENTSTASSGGGGVSIYALLSTPTAWGYNYDGELGNGTTTDSNVPVGVSGLNASDVKSVSGGSDFSLALKNDGTVWAWGFNSRGQLGDGTSSTVTQSSTPVQVKDSNDPSGYLHASAISAGGAHSLALKSDGTVKAWGNNQDGQLGNGSASPPPCYCEDAPVAVSHLSGTTSIAAGGAHSLAD